jgi:TatD family hydrolase
MLVGSEQGASAFLNWGVPRVTFCRTPFCIVKKTEEGSGKMLFDTHAHLNAIQYEEDIVEVIQRAQAENVTHIVVVGFDKDTIKKAMELTDQYDMIYAAVGWHPVDAIDMKEEDLEWIKELALHPKVVAIGEMGLDYYWDKSPKEIQSKRSSASNYYS